MLEAGSGGTEETAADPTSPEAVESNPFASAPTNGPQAPPTSQTTVSPGLTAAIGQTNIDSTNAGNGYQIGSDPSLTADDTSSSPAASQTPVGTPEGQTGNDDGSLPQGTALSNNDLERRVTMLVKKFPSLAKDPQTTLQLAQQPVTDDVLIGTVGKAQSATAGAVQADIFNRLTDPTARFQMWQALTQPVQDAMKANGIIPPQDPKSHGGFWSHLSSDLNPFKASGSSGFLSSLLSNGPIGALTRNLSESSDVVGHALGTDVMRPAAQAFDRHLASPLGLPKVGHDVANAAGNLAYLPSHVYKALRANPQDPSTALSGNEGYGDTFMANLLSGDSQKVSQIWEATSQHKQFLTSKAQDALDQAFPNDPDLQQLAKATANHGGDVTAGIEQVLGKPTYQANGMATNAYQAKATALAAKANANPHFNDALRAVSLGGVSPGRDAATTLGLKEGSTAYNAVSGAGDALFQWYANPLVVAGKVHGVAEAARAIDGENLYTELDRTRLSDETAARLAGNDTTSATYYPKMMFSRGYGEDSPIVDDSQPIRRIIMPPDTVARRRWATALADHVDQGNYDAWSKANPRGGGAYTGFQEWARENVLAREPDKTLNANDVNDWLRSQSGSVALARADVPAFLSHNDLQLPRLSRVGLTRLTAKLGAVPSADLVDRPIDPDDLDPADPHAGQHTAVLSGMTNRVFQLLRPSNTDETVHLEGDEAAESFERFVNQFGLPTWQRGSLVNGFANSLTPADRREVVQQALNAGMKKMGFGQSEAGRAAIDNMVRHNDQVYDPFGRDLTRSGAKATLFPDAQVAKAIWVPGIRTLAGAARQANVASVLNNGLMNPELETMMHKYWTVTALFRLGFIPRVVSEEWMTALMRLRPSEIAKGYAGEYLPGAQARFRAWDPTAGKGPASFARILAGTALGVAAHAAGPDVMKAGTQVYNARQMVREGNRGWKELSDLAKNRAETADLFGIMSGKVADVGADVAAKRDELRALFEKISNDPVIRRAWGKTVFSTGGGYRGASSLTDELENQHGKYNPVVRIPMSGKRKLYHNAKIDTPSDGAFKTAVADYYDELGRSGMARAGLRAIQGWTIDPADLAKMGHFAPDIDQSTPAAMLKGLRQRHSELEPETKQRVARFTKALSSGDTEEIQRVGNHLNAHADTLDGPSKRYVKGVLGDERYWRRSSTAIPELDINAPERWETPQTIHPNLLSALAAHPDAPMVRDPDEARLAAYQAHFQYLTDPANKEMLSRSNHFLNGKQGPLAEPVAPGYSRVYYPDVDRANQQPNPAGAHPTPERALHELSQRIRGATIGSKHPSTLDAIGYRSPATAQGLADELNAPLSYTDLPDPLATAQNLVHPHTTDRDGWQRPTAHAKEASDHLWTIVHNNGTLAENPIEDATWLHSGQTDSARSYLIDPQGQPATKLPDGTLSTGISNEDAARSLAWESANSLIDALAPKGHLLHGVAQDILANDGKQMFTAAHLSGIADADLPEVVAAQSHMVLPADHLYDRVVRYGFDHVLGPSIDAMVRSPLFILNYAKALRAAKIVEPHLIDQELRAYGNKVAKSSDYRDPVTLRQQLRLFDENPTDHSGPILHAADAATAKGIAIPDRFDSHLSAMQAWGKMEDHADDHLQQISVTRAIRDTVPYINDHNYRSNMAEWGRNIAPFGWAQESFLKRWGRAIEYTPDQIMRLELTLHGLASMGIIHKDQYGQSAITIPGSASLTKALTKLGVPYTIAQAVPLSMEVKNMTPGFNRPAAPAWGPLVSVPVGAMSAGKPAPASLDSTINGPGTPPGWAGVLEQLVPSGTVRNVASALFHNVDPQQYASARMQALQMLASGGHLPPDNATATQIQTFNDQLDNWTRNAMLLRATLGFITPATPQLDFQHMMVDGKPVADLESDLSFLIQTYGTSEGIARFTAANPDATAFTIFRSTSPGLLAPPATTLALSTIQAHKDFFDQHPTSGAYFLPQDAGAAYNRSATMYEQAMGMRRAKGWDDITTEMVTAAASQQYYAMHDAYIKALQGAQGDATTTAKINKYWSDQSKQFLAQNPLFDQTLTSSTSSVKRQQVLDDMRDALASGLAPKTTQTQHLNEMLNNYDSWQQARTALVGLRTSAATQQRAKLDQYFSNWATNYSNLNPDVALFYSRVIIPEITTADRTVGQQLEGAQLTSGS